jgi:Uma2 family endonuclease
METPVEDERTAIPKGSTSGLTLQEFMDPPGDFLELIRGEVVQWAPPGFDHGEIEGELFALLREYVRPRRLGRLVTEADFIRKRDPFTARAPDVAFVSQRRVKETGRGFYPGAPDLAVEILSPTETLIAAEAKARMYLRAGGSVVRILDPGDRTLRIYRPNQGPVLVGTDAAAAEPALSGFRCVVRRFFGEE